MSGEADAFVRQALAPERRPPIITTGVVGFARTRLFNSPTNALLTIAGALLIWFTIVPALKFLLFNAVWEGGDRNACLAGNAGHPVGACWPFIQAKFTQFVYGFYPEPERWRVNLTFLLAGLLLLPLLIPKAPAKTINATLLFIAFPVVAFFLLYGGGLNGFAVAWSADALSNLVGSIGNAGARLTDLGDATQYPLLSDMFRLLGETIVMVSTGALYLLFPLAWLSDYLQNSGQPVWADFAASAVIVSLGLFILNGAFRGGWHALAWSLATFLAIGIVIAVMGLDRKGLPVVDTRLWGGLLVTLVVSITGIVASMPIGILLALGRRSNIPLIRLFSVTFIEFWRGVPLITVLFFATYMLPLFLPGNFTVDGLVRVLIGIALFAGAYNAEVIRGGLQAIPRGQSEAALALGLSRWKTTGLIVLPQALRHVIPGLVNSFIAMFKDTSLVSIVALFDLLGQLRASFADPAWATPSTLFTGFAFTGMIYFAFCFAMSRYSLFVERRLNIHRRS